MREILQTALGRPEQLALHVVGGAETDRLFKLMESLAPAATWKAKRVRIEHGDGLRSDTLAQAARLGVVVIQNPTHFPPPPSGARPMFDRLSLLRSLAAAGVPLALGSDGGREEQNPFLNIMLSSSYAASPGEALSREQALLPTRRAARSLNAASATRAASALAWRRTLRCCRKTFWSRRCRPCRRPGVC